MGIFKREKEYETTVDLDKLSGMIETYLKDEKWKVQVGDTENGGKIIQTKKTGILRDIFAADRAFTIVLSKTPKGIKLDMGVGKWLQNIGVTVIESVLLTGLFIVIDVPEMLWNAEIENKIQKKIDGFVVQLSGEQEIATKEKTEKMETGEQEIATKEEKVETEKVEETK